MIRSFRDKETAKIDQGLFSRKLPHDIQRIAARKLKMINAAAAVDDLRIPPGNRLECLSGAREGQYSIRLNDQWRICFEWSGGHAYNVEIVDYH